MTKNLIQPTTLVDILRHRAQNQPDRLAYIFLKDGETEKISLTYAQLDRRVRTLAAKLQSFSASGERALLPYPQGLDYIIAFFGCLYAGIVAIPTFPPRPNRPDLLLAAIANDAQATIVLSTTRIISGITSRLAHAPELKNLHRIATDNLSDELADNWQAPDIHPDTLAFLQYTSGSTGTPKGVMVSHANLLHNSAYTTSIWQYNSESTMVTWLPIFHDMGLIFGILQPLYQGFPCYLMSPATFVQRPFRWLQAISRYKATHSGAPNFAYDLCVNKITEEQRALLDLSNWEMSLNAAEPVRAETFKKFNEYFKPCGLKPTTVCHGYGLAEATLIVGGAKKPDLPTYYQIKSDALEQYHVAATKNENEKNRQTLVGFGHPADDAKVIIVNPNTLTQCQLNEVGEIWVKSPSVAQGYWQRPVETSETFQAYLADTNEGPFLRTGDLGFVRADGELFVTGRIKDVIIIRGNNYYPQDIELTVEQSHPRLVAGHSAAISVEINGVERLVVAVEVEHRFGPRQQKGQKDKGADCLKPKFSQPFNVEEIVSSIRQAVSEQHDISVYAVLLLRIASIPKTSSGKIQRSACRKHFSAGSGLNIVGEWRQELADLVDSESRAKQKQKTVSKDLGSHSQTAETLQNWLKSKISEQLKITATQIDIREPLARYGLDSATAVSLSGELETWLDRQLSPTLVYDYPSIQALAQYLAAEQPLSKTTAHVKPKTANEAIAIIGIGCRFPGANAPDAFWHLLRDGINAIKEVPAERWDVNAFYDPNPDTPGKMNTRWGGFLDEVAAFDPSFFGISPREAENMDPQQRLLLEVSWEALENAGLAPNKLGGSQTGVFIGISTNDYAHLHSEEFKHLDAYSGTGNAFSIAANRLSYLWDLRGPSLAIDTACSSSLVAVNMACESLQQGKCDLALTGGVNLILSPELTIVFSSAQMMAADGRCKTFDASADGYVRGEGCGIIVLKRLSEAQLDGDNILAVIRGSAVNQDGRSNGLTAPNGLSQQNVVQQALENAGISPAQLSYVEAHGTGTSLGDPIEVNALKAVLMEGRKSDQPAWIGSVKTNIGHLEAAAGIAGLIKVVLSLQNKEIPPHLHFNQLNPHIAIADTPLAIPTEQQKWSDENRLAGVSSFGFGGTNAHVVLEAAPMRPIAPAKRQRPKHLFTISAQTEQALTALAQKYETYLQAHLEIEVADICFTVNTGRSHFDYRLAIVADSSVQLREQLGAFVAGKEMSHSFLGVVQQSNRPKVAFLFTGQGSQYLEMGRVLYETQPTFRSILDRCDEILRPTLEKNLLEVLYPAAGVDSPLDETVYTQPALFAFEYALAKLWQSWGIVPDAVMGHSVGEYVAACLAGVFSLKDGLKLIAARGRLMQTLCDKGDMLVLSVDETKAAQLIEPFTAEVSIAAINGPKNVVISGKHETIKSIIATLSDKENIKITRLQVSHAFHSPMMEPMLAEFERVAAEVTYAPPQIPLCSNVTGKLATDEIATPAYWVRHVRQPVRFAASMETLYQQGYETFVEIGPKSSLLGMGKMCLPDDVGTWLVSLRQDHDNWQQLLQSLGELYVRGVSIDWAGFDQDLQQSKVPLPTYPFQRQRYWCSDRQPNLMVPASALKPEYSLLGQSLDLAASDSIYFEHSLGPNNPAYLADHCIQGITILPAAAYVEMALAAATQSFQTNSWVLEAVSFHRPLILKQTTRVQTLLKTLSNQPGYQFEIWSEAKDREEQRKWLRHASGTIQSGKNLPDKEEITSNEAESTNIIAPATHYAKCQRLGYEYGPVFQAIKALEIRGHIATAQVFLPPNIIAETSQIIHPALLDASLQISLALLPKEILTNEDRLLLPAGIQQFDLMAKVPSQLTVTAQLLPIEDEYCANFTLRALDGTTVASIKRLTLKPATMKTLSMEDEAYVSFFYHPYWVQSLSNSAHSQAQKIMIIYAEESASLAKLMAACLTDKQVIYFTLGEENKQLSENQWQIKAADKQGFDAVLKTQPGIDHIYFMGGFHLAQAHKELDLSTLNRLQNQGVISLLQLIKSLDTCYISQNKIGPNGLALKVITNRTYPVYAADPVVPWGGSLFGITEVCSKEFIEINSINIDLDWSDSKSEEELQESVRALLEEPALEHGGRVAFRNGNRYTQKIEPMLLPTAESKAIPVKENGVYLILGGAGGIGLVFSHYLVEKYKARIIWIGRSELSEDKQQEIKKLQEKGGQIRYFQMDGTDLSGMQQVVNTVNEEWGAIQGVVHSALILHDQSLSTMEEDSFRQVLAPKIQASWVLSQVTKRQPLDFMLFFSSAQSFICSPGQSNYASGCTFKDAFAHDLKINHSVPVKIINWGYWGSVGVVSSDEYTRRLEAQGIQSIEPQEGLEAIERILSLPVTQMIAIKASKEILQGMGVEFESQATWITTKVAAPLNQIDQTQWPINLSVSAHELSESYHALNQWASLLILRAFQEMGLEQFTQQAFSTEKLKSTLQLKPGYDGLYHACLAMLEVAGFIKRNKHSLLIEVDNAVLKPHSKNGLLEQKEVLEKNYPWLIATIHLLWETGHRLPQILRGKVAATEVLFSDSAKELVEQFYLQEPLSIYTNQQIAYLVLDLVKSIKRVNQNQEKIRILELGAGTGSTSRLVLALLQPVSDNIEYRYTDISPFFIQRGTELFGETYPFVTFDTLDLEQSPQQKGYQAGSYDIIFAANVLHAITNISHTLQNVKYLLKSGGALILNELTQKQNFITLTFGLLDGWWLAQDKEKRIPHSPLLSTKQWSVALQDEAFENPLILDAPPLKKAYYSQHVIFAQSNGKIRMPVQPKIASSEPITTQQGVLDGAAEKSSLTPSRQDLVAASRETAQRELQDYMQRIVAQVMRMQTTELNTPNQPFLQRSLNKLGLDSLMAMDLRNRLRKDMNVEIEIQTFIGGTKVEEIIDLIHQQLLLQQINLNETQEQETESAADQDREILSL